MKHAFSKGFTLIELLVSITIIAVVLAVAMPNLLGMRQRARDAKRKAELNEVKKALQLYFTDFNRYPSANMMSPNIMGCGTAGTLLCPQGCANEFAAGGSSWCSDATVYMKRFPRMSGTNYGWNYMMYSPSGNTFCLTAVLENTMDPDIATSQAKCATSCTDMAMTQRCGDQAGEYCTCDD
jgi:prepilin-type N-terminal cleavage/methylation domain-containing protein